MEKTKKFQARTVMLSTLLLAFGVTAGCTQSDKKVEPASSNSPTAAATTTPAPAPVTLKVADALFPEAQKQFIVESMSKKYPHITINWVKLDYDLEKVAASNEIPDVMNSNTQRLGVMLSVGLAEDLTQLLKDNKIDLSRFEDHIMKQPAITNGGKINAMPVYSNFSALYYNKDIFDKFGIPYPTDGMTWEQTIKLGKQLTRNEGGVQYYGLGLNTDRLANALPAYAIDGKTNRATVNNEQWKMIYTLLKDNWSAPGMKQPGVAAIPNVEDMFMKTKNVAMIPGQSYVLRGLEAPSKEGLNFDIAQLPSHTGAPNTYEWDNTALIAVSKVSKNKDAAMKLLSFLASEEYQTFITERGQLSALKNLDKKKYGTLLAHLKGKNVAGIFKSHAPDPAAISLYYDQTVPFTGAAANEIIFKDKDINTAIREADEKINQKVDSMVKK